MKTFSFNEIRQALPQRAPMLMLDRAAQTDGTHWLGVKNLTANEHFFQGHFPDHPIMPGVLQVEAMKQLGELAFRLQHRAGIETDLFLQQLEKVKFRRPNNPGDRAKIEIEILEDAPDHAIFQGSVSNNSGLACEAKLTIAARKRDFQVTMPELFNEFDKADGIPMDVQQLKGLMPHRYPFLFIDDIVKIEGDHIIAVKNLSGNEEFFSHNTVECALPESILCEIVAQSGCACVLSRPENKGKIGYFMSIDKAESLLPVVPGDQLVIDIVLPPGKSRFGKGSGIIRVEGKEVFKITLMFAIVDA